MKFVNTRGSLVIFIYLHNQLSYTLCFFYHEMQILDDTFASQMQQLVGNTLEEKDVEPPRSIVEVRSMLCKDAASYKNDTFYY